MKPASRLSLFYIGIEYPRELRYVVQLARDGGCVADTVPALTLTNSTDLDLDILCLVPGIGGGSASDVGTVTGNLFQAPFARKFSGNPETIGISKLREGTYTI